MVNLANNEGIRRILLFAGLLIAGCGYSPTPAVPPASDLKLFWADDSKLQTRYDPDPKRRIVEVSVGRKKREIIGMPLNGPCVKETTYEHGLVKFADGSKQRLRPLTIASVVDGGPFTVDGAPTS